MTRVVDEVMVPSNGGGTIELKKNQVLRVIDVEGGQVGDMVVLNRQDFNERFSGWLSQQLHENLINVKTLYTNPPFMRPILSIEEDKVGDHWPGANRCNRVFLAQRHERAKLGCQEILERTLAPYKIEPYDVPDVFNVFMKMEIHEDGTRKGSAAGRKGDYTDFRAHLNCLIGMSACPMLSGKPLLMQVIDR